MGECDGHLVHDNHPVYFTLLQATQKTPGFHGEVPSKKAQFVIPKGYFIEKWLFGSAKKSQFALKTYLRDKNRGYLFEIASIKNAVNIDGSLLFYNFNHLKGNPDDGFIVLTCLEHIFIILLIVPVNDYFTFTLVYGLKLLENIKDAL